MLRRMALLVLVLLLGTAAGVMADRTPLAVKAGRVAHVVTERIASRVPARLKRVVVRVRSRVPERVDRLVERLVSK